MSEFYQSQLWDTEDKELIGWLRFHCDNDDTKKFFGGVFRCISNLCYGRTLEDCYSELKSIHPISPSPLPIDSLADSLMLKCIALGVLDTAKAIQNEDGERCVAILCGEEAAKSEFPEAERLIRECYGRHFLGKRSLE
jgi:hypothetical protein